MELLFHSPFFPSLFPSRNDGAFVFFSDEFLDGFRLIVLDEFLISRLILVLLAGSDDHDGERGILVFEEDALVFRGKAGAHDVVHGDDGCIDISKASWKLSGFEFLEFQVSSGFLRHLPGWLSCRRLPSA